MRKLLCIALALVLALSLYVPAMAEEGVIEITVADQILEETGMDAFLAARQRAFDEAYPNIKVNHVVAPDIDATRMVQSIATLFIAEDAPVCTSVSAMFYAKDLYNMGMVADISAYVADLPQWADVYDSVIDGFMIGDSLVAYPASVEVPLLGVSRKALEALGYDPDTFTCATWDEYRQLVIDITEKTDFTAGATNWLNEWWLWMNNWVSANGAQIFTQNDDGTMTLNFADERLIETIAFWRELYKAGALNADTLNTANLNDIWQGIWDDKYASFTEYPTWASTWATSGCYADEVLMMAFPAGPSGDYFSEIFPTAYVFNSQCSEDEIKAAVQYIDFMYGYEGSVKYLEYAQENGVFMVKLPKYASIDWSLYNDAIPADWVTATNYALSNGRVSDAASTNYSTYLYQVLPELVMGDDDIAELLAEAQETAEAEWLDDFNEAALAN